MKKNEMIVAGVMSGTSADGIDVALVRIGKSLRIQLLGRVGYPYPSKVRQALLAAMNSASASVADLARLNSLLGELYADAVLSAESRFRLKAELVGCHGQTLYHQGERARFLGRNIATTWQAGESAVIAARVGVPVVSDFRPADMAAGGKGAPLVPFLDYLWFRDARTGRIVQNIGGIANLTAIPAGASSDDVVAFDTGPGNMVIDALAREYSKGKLTCDRDGRIAASGAVNPRLLAELLADPYYRRKPPKSAGREQYGAEFVARMKKSGAPLRDLIATATVLTAVTVALGVGKNHAGDLIVSGGGVHNPQIMAQLAAFLPNVRISTSTEHGVDADAKEAIAFAVLAHRTWRRKPGNLPSATGARRPVILGSITL